MGFPVIRTAAGVLFVAAATVSGVNYLNSKNAYASYEKSYDEMKSRLLANVAQPPEEIFKDNEYTRFYCKLP